MGRATVAEVVAKHGALEACCGVVFSLVTWLGPSRVGEEISERGGEKRDFEGRGVEREKPIREKSGTNAGY